MRYIPSHFIFLNFISVRNSRLRKSMCFFFFVGGNGSMSRPRTNHWGSRRWGGDSWPIFSYRGGRLYHSGATSDHDWPHARSPDIDPVSVNSLYSVYIFNITPYIQINYKIMSIESFPGLVMPWPNRWPIGQAPRINTTFCSRRKETVQKLIKWIEKVMTDNEVHTVLSYFTRLYLSMKL